MNHLLDWHLLPDDVWERQIEAALRIAHDPSPHQRALGKGVGLLFFNPSLRTRTSMEVAAAKMGAHSSVIVPGQGTWGFAWDPGAVMDGTEAEHIREAAGVLSRYFEAIGVRLFASMTDYAQDRDEVRLRQFVEAATVPVINLESAFYHPCQALADAAVMQRRFNGAAAGKRFVLQWCYHPKALPMAVPHSALLAAARLGMNVTVARPEGYALDPGVMDLAQSYAAARGARVEETDDADSAYDGADVIYAKAWGGPASYATSEAAIQAEQAVRNSLRDWRVTAERMNRTREGAFMHCLPVRRNVVVDDAVLDGPHAIHLDQAAFRLHGQRAILERAWGPEP